MDAIVRAMLLSLDDEALDLLATKLAPRITSSDSGVPSVYLNVPEAADYLRARPQRIYDLVSAGALIPVRDGKRLLFKRATLDAYLAAGAQDEQKG